jgi:hypothetical protein
VEDISSRSARATIVIRPAGVKVSATFRCRGFQQISEDRWLQMVKTRDGHPPMTWHDVQALTIDDQRSIYPFIRSLGPAGSPSLPDVPSQREPKTPYFMLVQPK